MRKIFVVVCLIGAPLISLSAQGANETVTARVLAVFDSQRQPRVSMFSMSPDERVIQITSHNPTEVLFVHQLGLRDPLIRVGTKLYSPKDIPNLFEKMVAPLDAIVKRTQRLLLERLALPIEPTSRNRGNKTFLDEDERLAIETMLNEATPLGFEDSKGENQGTFVLKLRKPDDTAIKIFVRFSKGMIREMTVDNKVTIESDIAKVWVQILMNKLLDFPFPRPAACIGTLTDSDGSSLPNE